MRHLKTFMTVFTLTIFYFALCSSAALAANLVIDKQTGPVEPGIFHTRNFANDSACIQAALDKSKSGDTITIRKGDYYLPLEVKQTGKSLNIIGDGRVTLHMQTPDRGLDKELNRELFFNGSMIINTTLNVDAKKGQLK